MTNISVDDRFWAKVDKTASCWNWTANTDTTGYGQFKVDGKQRKAHRIAFEMRCGSIPANRVLDHVCHNRACVNPDHLRLVTTKQNAENLRGPQARSASGIRGVYKVPGSKTWRAILHHHGTRIHVGSFATKEDADDAVRRKRNDVFTHNDIDRIHEAVPTGAASVSQGDK